jgi:23S rRNA (cytosine1962-C5)-methyltransferase
MISVKVNRKAADRVAAGHPWIFLDDITDRSNAAAGDTVTVIDPRGRRLGSAHYSSTSRISLRMLPLSLEEALDKAVRLRESIVSGTDAYRLVHAEGDQLPGLIVDRYGPCFAIQLLSQGMDRAGGQIADYLERRFSPAAIVARNDAPVRKQENLEMEKRVLRGEPPAGVPVVVNGLKWYVSLLEGQKTGIYLDQRENYAAAARYARGRALDCFTSTGGFALHLAARCESVEAIDSSEIALQAAIRNRDANGISNVEFRKADVFEQLSAFVHARRRFDMIVLDPPAFAKSRSAAGGALRGYRDINYHALQLLESGGILVTCSCSHHIAESALLEVLAEASLDAGRTLRILERRTQARDHPILLTVPETHYLKCLVLQVV